MSVAGGNSRGPAGRIAAVVAGLLIVALTSCAKREAKVEVVASVQAAKVQRGAIERVVDAEAILYPLEEAAITPKVNAPVARFYVNRGSRVRKGELLAVLEHRDLSASVVENQGAYEQAQAAYASTAQANLPQELEKAKLDVRGTRQSLAAQTKLYQSRKILYAQGALPRKQLDQSLVLLTDARNRYQLARQHLSTLRKVGKEQQLNAAKGQLQSAQGKFLGARAQLAYTEIRSPIDGVVTDRPLYAGETPPPATPLLTIMNTAKVIARAHIPQEEAALLKPGDPATMHVPGVGTVAARVTLVSPAVDPNSTTVEIWVEAANPAGRLRPGTAVHLEMVAAKVPDALVIPSSALLTGPGGTTVMVVGSDGRAHQKQVAVGIRHNEEVQITRGLSAGELVVSSGAYALPDGTKVRITGSATHDTPQNHSFGARP